MGQTTHESTHSTVYNSTQLAWPPAAQVNHTAVADFGPHHVAVMKCSRVLSTEGTITVTSKIGSFIKLSSEPTLGSSDHMTDDAGNLPAVPQSQGQPF